MMPRMTRRNPSTDAPPAPVREIAATVSDVRTEAQVREIVADVNARVLDARRRGVDGPRIAIPTVDVEQVVQDWRTQRR